MRTATITIEIECSADEAYFGDDLPDWVKNELNKNGGINCEGAGPGSWCYGCRFCEEYRQEREE